MVYDIRYVQRSYKSALINKCEMFREYQSILRWHPLLLDNFPQSAHRKYVPRWHRSRCMLCRQGMTMNLNMIDWSRAQHKTVYSWYRNTLTHLTRRHCSVPLRSSICQWYLLLPHKNNREWYRHISCTAKLRWRWATDILCGIHIFCHPSVEAPSGARTLQIGCWHWWMLPPPLDCKYLVHSGVA